MWAKRVRRVGVAALLAALAGLGLLGSRGGVADDKPAGKSDLPADIAKVPRSALLFMTFRPADMWEHDIGKGIRKEIAAELPKATEDFVGIFGLPPAEIERLTVILLDPNSG